MLAIVSVKYFRYFIHWQVHVNKVMCLMHMMAALAGEKYASLGILK